MLALPALTPVVGAAMGLARWSKSDRLWQRALAVVCGVLVFPLFLIAVIAFIPYFVVIQILMGIGVVRRDLPPMLIVAIAQDDYWRIDLSVAEHQRRIADGIIAELRTLVGHIDVTWMEEGGRLDAEISIEGKVDALCRSFVERVEKEDPVVEVHWG